MNLEDRVNIVFAIDENYVQHMSVALVSLLENNKNIHFSVFIIHVGITDKSINLVQNMIADYKCEVSFLPLKDDLFANLKVDGHFSKAVFFLL